MLLFLLSFEFVAYRRRLCINGGSGEVAVNRGVGRIKGRSRGREAQSGDFDEIGEDEAVFEMVD